MENYWICSDCGQGFAYSDKEVKDNTVNAAMNVLSGLGTVAGALSGNWGGTIANKMNEKELRDFSKCPYCGSHNLQPVTQEKFQREMKKRAGGGAAVTINANASVESLIKRTKLLLEDKEWDTAEAYCSQMLDADPENAEIYFLQLLIEKEKSSYEDLKAAHIDIRQSKYYKNISRFAQGDFAEKIEELNASFDAYTEAKRLEAEKAKEEAKRKKQLEQEKKYSEAYDRAVKLLSNGTLDDTKLALSELTSVDRSYKNTEAYIVQARAFISEKEAELEKDKAKTRKKILLFAIPAAVILLGLLLTFVMIIPSARFNKGKALLEAGEYDQAITVFKALKGYDNSEELIREAENALAYEKATALLDAGEFDEAIQAFESLGSYKDSADQIEAALAAKNSAADEAEYAQAIAYMDAGKYADAKKIFEKLGNYKDSPEYLTKAKLYTAKAGDIICFGSYEQDNNSSNGKEVIEWIVLERENDQLFLLSRYALDCIPYNTERKDVTWETCTLRAWLNDSFLKAAFSMEEQDRILSTTVKADKNPDFKTDPGNDTVDRVFLLSNTQVKKFLPKKDDRKCISTNYATAKGVETSNEDAEKIDGKPSCYWWLRSPGVNLDDAAIITFVYYDRGAVSHNDVGVRPAIWIDLGD